MSYLTDGVHLYEKISWRQNFGRAGGRWLTVCDCRTENVGVMCDLELALCESVPDAPQGNVSANTSRGRKLAERRSISRCMCRAAARCEGS
jgi:hypothetical protein